MSNFARIKYETEMHSDSDDSQQFIAEKKKKRKRFNSGSSNQSKPRIDKRQFKRKFSPVTDGVPNKDLLQRFQNELFKSSPNC